MTDKKRKIVFSLIILDVLFLVACLVCVVLDLCGVIKSHVPSSVLAGFACVCSIIVTVICKKSSTEKNVNNKIINKRINNNSKEISYKNKK